MIPTVVLLGLGANLGDREANIRRALDALDSIPGIEVCRVSSLRETAPVGGPPQGHYLNGVAELNTSLSAPTLLELCKQIERECGRDLAAERDAPRPLDLDILAFGRESIDTRDLVVPHPRLFGRTFVTEPLAELGVDVAVLRALRPSRPRVVQEPSEFGACHGAWRRGGCRIGIVPTMGALHAGHAALLRRAREECDRVTATIFVNPLQFDAATDLAAYPRDLERDLELCAAVGVDAVFAPQLAGMYPTGFASRVAVGEAAQGMEGASRAGHFEGVATVVAKLLVLAGPVRAYFGAKDAQQLAVVRRVVADLHIPAEIVECSIVRDANGLALSSRNARLVPQDRAAATVFWRALAAARDRFAAGERSARALLSIARGILASEPRAALEYLELRSEGALRELGADRLGDDGARMLVAARFAGDGACETRLIDNMSLATRPEA